MSSLERISLKYFIKHVLYTIPDRKNSTVMNLSTRSVLKTTVVCSLWSYTKKNIPDSINNNKKKSSFVYKYIYALPATYIHILTNIHPLDSMTLTQNCFRLP